MICFNLFSSVKIVDGRLLWSLSMILLLASYINSSLIYFYSALNLNTLIHSYRTFSILQSYLLRMNDLFSIYEKSNMSFTRYSIKLVQSIAVL